VYISREKSMLLIMKKAIKDELNNQRGVRLSGTNISRNLFKANVYPKNRKHSINRNRNIIATHPFRNVS